MKRQHPDDIARDLRRRGLDRCHIDACHDPAPPLYRWQSCGPVGRGQRHWRAFDRMRCRMYAGFVFDPCAPVVAWWVTPCRVNATHGWSRCKRLGARPLIEGGAQ